MSKRILVRPVSTVMDSVIRQQEELRLMVSGAIAYIYTTGGSVRTPQRIRQVIAYLYGNDIHYTISAFKQVLKDYRRGKGATVACGGRHE